MFYYKYSKLTRWVIWFNLISAVLIFFYHIYNLVRVFKSNQIINDYIKVHHVLRETAIRRLQDLGENIYISDGASATYGIMLAVTVVVLLIIFMRNNSFVLTMLTASICTILNFIGGALLFYLILTQKLESAEAIRNAQSNQMRPKDGWEDYIASRAKN